MKNIMFSTLCQVVGGTMFKWSWCFFYCSPGLYQGWFPVISSLWCSNFVYFYSYNFLKLVFYGKTKPTPLKDIGAASLAGTNIIILLCFYCGFHTSML